MKARPLHLLALWLSLAGVSPPADAVLDTALPDPPRALSNDQAVLAAKQGGVLYLTFRVEGHPASVTGRYRDRPVPFFPTGQEGEVGALIGIDLADEPGTAELKADLTYPDGVRSRLFQITVGREDFREQRMTLPKRQVEPDAPSLRRIGLEQEKVKRVFADMTPARLWSRGFLVPVPGPVTGAFGSRRILNGQPRNPHNGEDIAAPLGTPVKASNDGIVRMVDDHFFGGNGVIVDHGLGLYTMYFHLDRSTVKEGQRIARGQVIGTVGQTGRATGPHLHWGAWLNGARVNPFALTTLPFDLPSPRAKARR